MNPEAVFALSEQKKNLRIISQIGEMQITAM